MEVKIYTDGAARGNPDGPGGYGAVLTYMDREGKLYKKEISAGYRKTTNNRMELMAAIRSLQELTRPCRVELYSDSKYLVDAFNKNWVSGWLKKGWKRQTGNQSKTWISGRSCCRPRPRMRCISSGSKATTAMP